MTHLADLLGNDHPLFVYNIAQLEKASGNAGIDVRLIADINQKVHHVLSGLGIDSSDLYPDELYQALMASARRGEADKLLRNTQYVIAICEGQAVSLNLQDVNENIDRQRSLADASLKHAHRYLRAEIIARYAAHDRTSNDMVEKLAQEAGLKPAKDAEYNDTKEPLYSKHKPTMYAIGDIFSDVFIELREEESSVEKDDEGNEWLKIPFGSKPPYEQAITVDAVGPSPNAGVSAERLGVDVALLSWMGDDKVATATRRYLTVEGIDHTTITSAIDTLSNTYYVLRRGAERTILVKNEEYQYDWIEPPVEPEWLYLSLISEKSWQLHLDMLTYLEKHPSIKLAFQPGTFHFRWGKDKLADIYKRSHIVVLNREEAVEVTGADHSNIRQLAETMHALGPDIVVITDGMHGSYAYYDDKLMTVPNYPDIAPPLDRTGAGDAFASSIVAALALGETMETGLLWAPINSMNVVQQIGAQAGLQTHAEIKRWLKKAPTDYKVTELAD